MKKETTFHWFKDDEEIVLDVAPNVMSGSCTLPIPMVNKIPSSDIHCPVEVSVLKVKQIKTKSDVDLHNRFGSFDIDIGKICDRVSLLNIVIESNV